MKILNLLKSEAGKNVELFIEKMGEGEDSHTIKLYEETVDWNQLVDEIFASNKVVCWW
jgi:hypothetical protein